MSGIRINVIGGSGSGTSTLGRALASALSIPHFESDDYFHAPKDPPFCNPRPAEERYELISRDLKPDKNWVLSGGISGWVPCPKLDFTCIVFLYVPTAVRIERLRLRERARFGNRIQEGGDMYDTHKAFIDWASRYDAGDIEGKTLAMHEAYLSNQPCPVFEYRDLMPVSDITASVLRSIREHGMATERSDRHRGPDCSGPLPHHLSIPQSYAHRCDHQLAIVPRNARIRIQPAAPLRRDLLD